LDEDIKRLFWEELDEVLQSIPQMEKLFIGGDFNGHIRRRDGYETIHGGFGYSRETMEGCLFWTLLLHMNYRLLTPISRKRKNTL